MLNISIGGITCKFSLLFPAVLVFMLYFDPSGMILVGLIAAILHEWGHLFALFMYRHRPQTMIFSFYGMKMIPRQQRTLRVHQIIVVLLAGPLINLVCAAISVLLGVDITFTLVHTALAAFNLLPIRPLDGGQIFHVAITHMCETRYADIVQNAIEYTAVTFLLISGVLILCHTKYNFSILVIAIYVILCKLFDKWN